MYADKLRVRNLVQESACMTLRLAIAMQSNPFGDAKPVDAAAKLRELEERETKRKVRMRCP